MITTCARPPIRLFKPRAVDFLRACSRECVAAMLRMLGRDEVESTVAEHGGVEVGCEFCNEQYCFDGSEARAVFGGESGAPAQATRR